MNYTKPEGTIAAVSYLICLCMYFPKLFKWTFSKRGKHHSPVLSCPRFQGNYSEMRNVSIKLKCEFVHSFMYVFYLFNANTWFVSCFISSSPAPLSPCVRITPPTTTTENIVFSAVIFPSASCMLTEVQMEKVLPLSV